MRCGWGWWWGGGGFMSVRHTCMCHKIHKERCQQALVWIPVWPQAPLKNWDFSLLPGRNQALEAFMVHPNLVTNLCASAPSRALCAQQYDSTDVILPGIGSFCSFSAPSNCALDYRANSLADGWCHKYSNSFWWQLACTTMLGYGVQAEEALT